MRYTTRPIGRLETAILQFICPVICNGLESTVRTKYCELMSMGYQDVLVFITTKNRNSYPLHSLYGSLSEYLFSFNNLCKLQYFIPTLYGSSRYFTKEKRSLWDAFKQSPTTNTSFTKHNDGCSHNGVGPGCRYLWGRY